MKRLFSFIFILFINSSPAQDAYVDSLEAALQASSDVQKINIYLDLSKYFSYTSYEKVIEYGKKALDLSQKLNDKDGLANAFYRLGEGLVNQKEYDKAFEYYLKSLRFFEEIEDPEGIFMANNGIGRAYDSAGKYQKSFEYYSAALAQAEKNQDKKQQSVALLNIGSMIGDIGKPLEEKIEYYKRSYNLAEEVGAVQYMVFSLINMADTYTKLNKSFLAIKNLNQGIKLAEQSNLNFALFHLYGNLGLAQKKESKYSDALGNLQKSLDYLSPEDLQWKLKVYSELPELFYLNNRYKEAYESLLIKEEIKDTLFSKNRDQRFSELQTKYETEKKQAQIELLEKDNQIQTLWRNSFIGAFIFAFILSVGLYNRYRYKNKTSKELTKLNNQLEGELKQAAEYIESLLPLKLDEKVKTDWKFIPSAHLGGDSFGYSFLDENHFALYLIDVSGHGVGAALLSTSVLNILKSKSLPNTDFYNPAEVLNNLNRSFNMEEHDDKYFALWYGVLDLKTYELVCASAFHPPAIGITNGQSIKYGKKEMMIGAFEDYNYENAFYQLSKGESIFLFSDGCFEIESEISNFEFDDFVSVIKSAKDTSEQPLDDVYSSLVSLKKSENFDDDFSMINIKLQ